MSVMKQYFEWRSIKRGNISLALVSGLSLIAAIPLAEAQTYKVIHTFRGGKDGIEPEAGLLRAPDGNLYGTTYQGGSSSDTGTVFKLEGGRENVFTFPGCSGAYPNGGGPEGGM